MAIHFSPYTLLYLVPAVISMALAAYAWQQRARSSAAQVALLMAAVATWCICHALSISSSDLQGTLFWAQLQYIGIVLVPPTWLLFAMAYTKQWQRVSLLWRLALYLPSLLALVAVLTTRQHGLWWYNIQLDTSRPFLSLAVARGVLFWMWFSYTYACVLIGLGLLLQAMIGTPLRYKRQTRVVVIGAIFPMLANLAHLSGLTGQVVDDPTPILFAVSGMFFFYGAFRYQLFDLQPIAQREIFASLPDGVVVIDRKQHVFFANPLAPRLLAIASRDWSGASLDELLKDSPLAAGIHDMLAVGAPLTRSLAHRTNGQLQSVELRLRPLLLTPGTQVGTVLVLRDTTEREQAQYALEQRLAELMLLSRLSRMANAVAQTETMLRTIAEAILRALPWDRISIGLLEPGGTTFRLVLDQPRAGNSYQGEAIAANEFAQIAEDLHHDRPQIIYIGEARYQGTPVAAVFAASGSRVGLLIPLLHQAELLGFLFAGQRSERQVDSDELHVFEAVGQLISESVIRARLYDDAQQANQVKSAFLATISHELRTPLTSVIGYTEMLERGIFGPLPAGTSEPLGHIRHSGQMLLRLINDLLDVSKIEAGHFIVETYPVDLEAVVHTVAGALRPQLEGRHLALRLDLHKPLPPVYANSGRLEQVLTNLLMNAIKFTNQGTITISAQLHDDGVRLSVADTGIGIAAEHLGLIFEVFRQVEGQHTQHFRGTGLGLAISRGLLEAMGGSISVESTPGVGTVFHCDLRVAVPVVAPREVARQAGALG